MELDSILRSCPRWIVSNDQETRTKRLTDPSMSMGQLVIAEENTKFKVGNSDWGGSIKLSKSPVQADFYTSIGKINAQISDKWGYANVKTADGREFEYPDPNAPMYILHGVSANKVDDFASLAGQGKISISGDYGNQQAYNVQFWAPHGVDGVGRSAYVQCNIILPISISGNVAQQLPNADATSNILYNAFPKKVIDHFIDKLGAQERVIARIDQRAPGRKYSEEMGSTKKSFWKRLFG